MLRAVIGVIGGGGAFHPSQLDCPPLPPSPWGSHGLSTIRHQPTPFPTPTTATIPAMYTITIQSFFPFSLFYLLFSLLPPFLFRLQYFLAILFPLLLSPLSLLLVLLLSCVVSLLNARAQVYVTSTCLYQVPSCIDLWCTLSWTPLHSILQYFHPCPSHYFTHTSHCFTLPPIAYHNHQDHNHHLHHHYPYQPPPQPLPAHTTTTTTFTSPSPFYCLGSEKFLMVGQGVGADEFMMLAV